MLNRLIFCGAAILGSCVALPAAMADDFGGAGDFARPFGMDESFDTPISVSTRDENGARKLAPQSLQGTLNGGLMDFPTNGQGSFQTVGNMIVITLEDGRTLVVDPNHTDSTSTQSANTTTLAGGQ